MLRRSLPAMLLGVHVCEHMVLRAHSTCQKHGISAVICVHKEQVRVCSCMYEEQETGPGGEHAHIDSCCTRTSGAMHVYICIRCAKCRCYTYLKSKTSSYDGGSDGSTGKNNLLWAEDLLLVRFVHTACMRLAACMCTRPACSTWPPCAYVRAGLHAALGPPVHVRAGLHAALGPHVHMCAQACMQHLAPLCMCARACMLLVRTCDLHPACSMQPTEPRRCKASLASARNAQHAKHGKAARAQHGKHRVVLSTGRAS